MDLAASLLTFTMFWKMIWSLYCYTCDPERTPHAPSCEHFDYSSKYLTDCPSSTMCYKRITTLDFGNGVTSVGLLRGCAQQTWDGEQEKVNGKWRHKSVIHEPYEEKCEEDLNDQQRTTKTIHCYCRGDMCNGVGRLKNSMVGHLIITVALLVLRP